MRSLWLKNLEAPAALRPLQSEAGPREERARDARRRPMGRATGAEPPASLRLRPRHHVSRREPEPSEPRRAIAPPQRPAGQRASERAQHPRLGPRPPPDREPGRFSQPSPLGLRTTGAWPRAGRAPSSGGRDAARPDGRVDAAPGTQ